MKTKKKRGGSVSALQPERDREKRRKKALNNKHKREVAQILEERNAPRGVHRIEVLPAEQPRKLDQLDDMLKRLEKVEIKNQVAQRQIELLEEIRDLSRQQLEYWGAPVRDGVTV